MGAKSCDAALSDFEKFRQFPHAFTPGPLFGQPLRQLVLFLLCRYFSLKLLFL
jgi:hypothetical protein